jgi:hypothetical protein
MSKLSELLQPCDIINFEENNWNGIGLFMRIAIAIGSAIIIADQKKVFGSTSRYKDHHTMMYFGKDDIFSVQPPKPTWLKLDEFEQGDNRILSVYRWNGRKLIDKDIGIMKKAADRIIGWEKSYDIGQLVDFLISSIAGYPFDDKIKWFDFGRKHLVCSVGVASVMNHWRHTLWETTGEDIKQPFRQLNPDKWSPEFIEKFKHDGGYWRIDRTFPANYANPEMFANEFTRIGRFKAGELI